MAARAESHPSGPLFYQSQERGHPRSPPCARGWAPFRPERCNRLHRAPHIRSLLSDPTLLDPLCGSGLHIAGLSLQLVAACPGLFGSISTSLSSGLPESRPWLVARKLVLGRFRRSPDHVGGVEDEDPERRSARLGARGDPGPGDQVERVYLPTSERAQIDVRNPAFRDPA